LEPLTISALAEALSVELGSTHLNTDDIIDEAAILDGCGSLIRLSSPDNVVELAHFTVKEFLISIKSRGKVDLLLYDVEEQAAGLRMALVCLTHCSFDNFSHDHILDTVEQKAESQRHPFRSYAASCWYDHARQQLGNAEVMILAKNLLRPSKSANFVSWAAQFIIKSGAFAGQLVEDPLLCINSTTILHWASFLLLPELCQWLLAEGLHVNRPSQIGRPLHSAVCQDWASTTGWRGLVLATDRRDYRLEVVATLHNGGAHVNAIANMNGLSADDYSQPNEPSVPDVNREDKFINVNEISPLPLSWKNHMLSVFRFLLQAGAVCDAKLLRFFVETATS
jgi:hypothetical protein